MDAFISKNINSFLFLINIDNYLQKKIKCKSLPLHNLPTRVGPGSKLEVALLVVKGKPGDVDLARRLDR